MSIWRLKENCVVIQLATPIGPAQQVASAQLDGMVWCQNPQAKPACGHSVASSEEAHGVNHDFRAIAITIYIYILIPRPWAYKLYRRLTKADKTRLGLTSNGVVKKTIKADGSTSVSDPWVLVHYWVASWECLFNGSLLSGLVGLN